ncbi:unnamed protein product [Bathycoccus prasinos]
MILEDDFDEDDDARMMVKGWFDCALRRGSVRAHASPIPPV